MCILIFAHVCPSEAGLKVTYYGGNMTMVDGSFVSLAGRS